MWCVFHNYIVQSKISQLCTTSLSNCHKEVVIRHA